MLSEDDETGQDAQVLTLQDLIRSRMDDRGWGYAELARRSDHELTAGRWQQMGSGARQTEFPKTASIRSMARALDVDETTVVLAVASSVGLDVRRQSSDLAHLLPSGTNRLSERLREAILAVIRAAVADTLVNNTRSDDLFPGMDTSIPLEWSKRDAPSHRKPTDGDEERHA